MYHKNHKLNHNIQSAMNFAISQGNIEAMKVMVPLVDKAGLLNTFIVLQRSLKMIDIVSKEIEERKRN